MSIRDSKLHEPAFVGASLLANHPDTSAGPFASKLAPTNSSRSQEIPA